MIVSAKKIRKKQYQYLIRTSTHLFLIKLSIGEIRSLHNKLELEMNKAPFYKLHIVSLHFDYRVCGLQNEIRT